MRSVPPITPTAINHYIEKFHPNFSRRTAEKRLKIAVGNPVSNRVFTGGRSYAQIKIGNGHDGVCYAVFEGDPVVDILTKQEYGEQHRPR
jgi:hypothetical protein